LTFSLFYAIIPPLQEWKRSALADLKNITNKENKSYRALGQKEDVMEFSEFFALAKTIVLVAVFAMAIAIVGILYYKEGLVEVSPARAWVVRNIWTSKARALLETDFIIPGWEKKLREVTLENEPRDPPIMKALTKDGTEVGVDLVFSTQKIDVGGDNEESRLAVVRAATEINYDKRNEAIDNRIKIYLQDALVCCALEDIVEGNEENSGGKRATIQHIEETLKGKLDEIKNEWGFGLAIGVRNLELPEKAKEVAEESATAEQEGRRIKTKADAAGVEPWMVVASDGIYDVIRAIATGFKKGGNS